MKYLAKNKNLIIAIILSIILAVAGFLTIFFTNQNQVSAEDNYGTFNENGYYSLDGVAFYAIKVKNVKYQAKPQFGKDGKTHLTLTITKKSGGDIPNVNYNTIYKCLDGTFYYSTNGTNFEEINATAKKSGDSAINLAEIEYEYYPTYDLSLDSEGKIQYVKYGDTVLLEKGESLMLSFARQEESKVTDANNKVLETKLIGSAGNFVSDYVDFLNISIKSNENTVVSDFATGEKIDNGITKKFFGYILSPYDDVKITPNEEGLVEFKASYQHGSTMNNFGFSFYVFKKSTYQRVESYKNFNRPNTMVDVLAGNGNYVVDNATANQYYAEYFYFYQNQKLTTLTYNPERYEISISKTVFSTLTTYNFSYDKTSGEIIYSKTPSLSTEDVYARDITFKKLEDGNIQLTFKDIGVYDISYKAVYFKNDQKVELKTLNEAFSLKDRLTIYGTQATYNDLYTKQTELRNNSNTISADITGKITPNIPESEENISNNIQITMNLGELTIASTNQPQVRFLANSTLKSFAVYYTKDLVATETTEPKPYKFALTNYSITSNLTESGYYLVKVTHAYSNYKIWNGSTAILRDNEEKTQYFLFQIKDQTPNINILEVANNDGTFTLTETKVMSGYYDANNVYQGSYHKDGVFFEKLVENSEFDLPTTFKLERKGFEENANWASVTLNETTISEKNGYFITADGHYRLVVNFGNSSNTRIYFDIDNQDISGIEANKVMEISGSKYFAYIQNSQMSQNNGIIYTTSNPFTLYWNEKASGAKITASYVRFAMETSTFSDTVSDYIKDEKVCADNIIRLSDNPITSYSKAQSKNLVTANEVLNLPGLYIFKMEDEAGNFAYYSIIFDNSTPVILQGTNNSENGELIQYEIIKSFNNIATDTRIFFGTHKLVKIDGTATSFDAITQEYLKQIFTFDSKNINGISDNNRVVKIKDSYFAQFKIQRVDAHSINGDKEESKTITNFANGYDIIQIEKDSNGNIIEKTYFYNIVDESGVDKSYSATINTDKTGMIIYAEGDIDLKITTQKTNPAQLNSDNVETSPSQRIIYYNAINYDKLYLTWATLTPDMDAYVNLDNNGLVLKYYELVYNSKSKTYEYASTPTSTIVITTSMVADSTDSEGKVKIPLNVVNGKTLAGKYVLTRTYTSTISDVNLSQVVGTDFGQRIMTFYVDRNELFSAPTGAVGSPQIGAYASLKFFDNTEQAVKFEELFMQSQASGNAVIRTNKLPVGIYIPVAKYGYLDNGAFVDNMLVSDVDNFANEFSPFKLYVSIISPIQDNGDYIEYVYAYAENGYYKLFGYYKKNTGLDQVATNIYTFVEYSEHSAWLTKNELSNTTQWQEGIYSIKITALKNTDTAKMNDKPYLQNFYFNFEVVGDNPKFDMIAQYPNYENMQDNELLSNTIDNKIYYYSNAEQIKFTWEDLSSLYMVKIDKNNITYKFSNGTFENLKVLEITTNGNINSFVLKVSPEATSLQITMKFEIYGTDSELQKLFPNGSYETTKTIIFDKKAPTTTIDALIGVDSVIGMNTSSSMIREVKDRYNISQKDGIYKYFVYATTEEDIQSKFFSGNVNTDTNRIYIREFNDKYALNSHEIGSPYDKNSSVSNVFNEQVAEINGWKKYDITSKNIQLDKGNYYEIVELDLAGNMTIYSIYICDETSQAELTYVKREKAGEDKKETLNLSNNFEINSREKFAVKNIKYSKDTYSYKYFKININGSLYLITPFNREAGYAYNMSTGEEVNLEEISLSSRDVAYNISIYDAVASKSIKNSVIYSGQIRVAEIGKNLNWQTQVDSPMAPVNVSLGFIVSSDASANIKIDEDSIKIVALNKEYAKTTVYSKQNNNLLSATTSSKTYYYITPADNEDWTNYVFLIMFKDNFGVQYSKLMMHSEPNIDRYTADGQAANDLTADMQSQTNILVSSDIYFNISNFYEISVEKKVNNEINFTPVTLDKKYPSGFTQVKLEAVKTKEAGYQGGVVVYKITAKANLDDFKEAIDGEVVDVGISEMVFTITIYNQFPEIVLRNANGEDITSGLFNKTITHSDDVYLSYLTGNNISDSYGFTSKVYLRLRGSSEGYVEIPSSYTISTPGTYDIKIQNFNENGSLAATFERDFVIASYDVTFYSVVKFDVSDILNPYKVIYPTGNVFKNGNDIINYHYIINSSSYEISVNNGVTATLTETINEGSYTTYIYVIESDNTLSGSNVKFSREIAITIIPETQNILGTSFAYFVGTNSETAEIYQITTANQDIYLFKNDSETSITLQWKRYYGIKQNIIYYEISRDGGITWSDKISCYGEGDVFKLNIERSGNYVIKFSDLAGNTQIISSSTGSRDRYRINFIKSVIFLVNGETPIDNAIYNDEVVINIPSSTLSYYQSNPTIVVTLNGESITSSKNKDGNYVFTNPGHYVVYFNATKNNNELGIEKISFTIINKNDSRWAFNYLNYNNYKINYIKYNDTYLDVSKILNGNEILMSVILGNNSYDNGIYTVSMSTNELPTQTFEFSFWLNNLKPDIEVSEEEGASTTNDIIVRLNTNNLYETVGDCKLVINNKEVLIINKAYFESADYKTNEQIKLTETSPYYIQIYTENGKLIYSYKVEIVDPLNTITIILIVVACVVVAVGVLLFVLLRKKMKVR